MAKVPRSTIAKALAARIASNASPTRVSKEIAAYLLSVRRTSELNSLMRDVMQLRADTGTVEVTAVSAYSLTPAIRADVERTILAHYPKSKKVVVSQVIDESLVGGVRLQLANQQLDLSLRAKLNRFKQLTAHNTASTANKGA